VSAAGEASVPRPWTMLAELTHACPLRCPYCSNPVELQRRSSELDTGTWQRVMAEAGRLGVVHAHLSGGEPLLRRDLVAIVRAARDAEIYTQLVTSGVGLDQGRLDELVAAGLHSVQLSVQHADPERSDVIAGTRSFDAKVAAARLVRQAGLPLGLNVVLHRHNLDALDALLALGVEWGVERIELANAQYYGWALANREVLLPGRAQLTRAVEVVDRWRPRLDERGVELVWVLPDYFEGIAKPCMGGWGAVSLTVTPDGTVLPCPAASVLPLELPSVRDRSLAWIWAESDAFAAYRGLDWMSEPCRSCPRQQEDLGGCRCQAFLLTGDATRTDPVCHLSPDHQLVRDLTDRTDAEPVSDPPSTAPVFVHRGPGRRTLATVAGPAATDP
jgi:PqqA peptide cyclase